MVVVVVSVVATSATRAHWMATASALPPWMASCTTSLVGTTPQRPNLQRRLLRRRLDLPFMGRPVQAAVPRL